MTSQATPKQQAVAGSTATTQRGTVLMRSTGLGKTELLAEIIGLKRQGDYLIMEVHTISPVLWKIRSGLSRRDLWTLIKSLMTVEIIAYLLNFRAWSKEPEHPGEY